MNTPYDSFADDYDRFVNWPERLAFELPFIKEILKRIGTHYPSVLDAACGTGQHALALAVLGYDAAGADLSPGMIERAQINADERRLQVRFEAAGFGELGETFSHGSFDSLFCLGNSLPHVPDQEGLAMALADFASVLKPGGLLLVQNRNFDQVLKQQARWMEPQGAREGEREWLFLRFYDFLDDGTINFNILRLQRKIGAAWQQQVTQTRLLPLTQAELQEALLTAGFGEIEWYGGLDGSPFEAEKSGNLVVVARRDGETRARY